MFTLDSEDAVLKTFRPKDRTVVELPADLILPVAVSDYLAWTHPSGGRVYLIFSVPTGVPTGVVFDSNGGTGPSVPGMCDWCHGMGPGTGIGLLTATVNAKKRAGAYICSDLSCKQKITDDANRLGMNPAPLITKLVARMGRFASEVLKIDLSGAGR